MPSIAAGLVGGWLRTAETPLPPHLRNVLLNVRADMRRDKVAPPSRNLQDRLVQGRRPKNVNMVGRTRPPTEVKVVRAVFIFCLSAHRSDTIPHPPCVITSIPAGLYFVLPFHPCTHIAPRLTVAIVPSPSENLTPERTGGTAPLTVTSLSIQCSLVSGKSSGVRSQSSSSASHWVRQSH